MSRKTSFKSWPQAILVLAAVIAAAMKMHGSGQPDTGSKEKKRTEQTESRNTAKPKAKTGWAKFENCSLLEDRNNDGDSFVLRHGNETHTIRLYFVDCPEKRRHQYNGQRLAEQGQAMGGLDEAQTIAVGEAARDFATELLRRGPVTMETRWEEVYDSNRYYAFVSAGGQDLGEALVSKGLGRIHTKGSARPGGMTEREGKERLRQFEGQARGRRLGAWGKR